MIFTGNLQLFECAPYFQQQPFFLQSQGSNEFERLRFCPTWTMPKNSWLSIGIACIYLFLGPSLIGFNMKYHRYIPIIYLW